MGSPRTGGHRLVRVISDWAAGKRRSRIVAIAGASGSGKSAAATLLSGMFQVASLIVSEDWYCVDRSHLPWQQRADCNMDHPDAIEHTLLARHLEYLRQGESVDAPTYDYATRSRRPTTRRLDACPLIIVEGILLLSSEQLKPCFDLRLHVDAPLDLCLHRRLLRDRDERGIDFEQTLRLYTRNVRPMFKQFVEPARATADYVVMNDEGHERLLANLAGAHARLVALLR